MIKYFTDSDEEIIIGVYSDFNNQKKIAKKIGNELGYSFLETTDQEWFDEEPAFLVDTVVIQTNHISEDYFEFISRNLYLYVIK